MSIPKDSFKVNNFIPFDIFQEEADWRVRWLNIGRYRFVEPFFEDSIRICLKDSARHKNSRKITLLDYLPIACEQIKAMKPTAFIFHISRCGSTLLSQLLSLSPKNVVISEAPVLDQILRLKFTDEFRSENARIQYLENTVQLLGQKRTNIQNYYFIKWDSWHLFFLDEIRKTFPDVPFLYLTREFDEVLESHRKRPGMQVVKGILEPAMFNSTDEDISQISFHKYPGYIIKKLKKQINEYMLKDSHSILLHYKERPLDNFFKVLEFLNLEYTPDELTQVIDRLKFHSKYPSQYFQA